MQPRAVRFSVPEDDYHADKLPEPIGGVPSLSNSLAKVLLDRSPAHAYSAHPRLGGAGREWPAATLATFDRGKLAHKLLLGKGAEIVVVDAEDWKTKAAREARDQARAAGKIPALRAPYDEAVKAAPIICDKLAACGVVLDGESEVQVAWHERIADPVLCRGMLDHLVFDARKRTATVYDLKTTADAKPESVSRSVVRYGYDTQRAAYSHAIEYLLGLEPAKIDFVFIFAETAPPYAVLPGRLDATLHARGEERWSQAVDVWADCLRTGVWPEYARSIVEIEAPPWMSGDIQIGFEE